MCSRAGGQGWICPAAPGGPAPNTEHSSTPLTPCRTQKAPQRPAAPSSLPKQQDFTSRLVVNEFLRVIGPGRGSRRPSSARTGSRHDLGQGPSPSPQGPGLVPLLPSRPDAFGKLPPPRLPEENLSCTKHFEAAGANLAGSRAAPPAQPGFVSPRGREGTKRGGVGV